MGKRIDPETVLVGSVDNLLRVFLAAEPRHIEAGAQWYQVAHDTCVALDGVRPWRIAGMIAALSPGLEWNRNVLAAIEVEKTGDTSLTYYGQNIRKSRLIKNIWYRDETDPLKVLKGNKVTAFYRAILNPTDKHAVTVIDSHMASSYCGVKFQWHDKQLAHLSKKHVYNKINDAMIQASSVAGVHPHTFQATVWLVWREKWQELIGG